MTLLFVSEPDPGTEWRSALEAARPGLPVRVYPDTGPIEAIRYALVWRPPAGLLAGLPNLQVIFSVGAGVDGILSDGNLPPGKPLVRMVNPGLTGDMVEYVTCHALRWHCEVEAHAANQAQGKWAPRRRKPFEATSIGILGLGVIGEACARALVPFGFAVRGWSRSQKRIEGVDCHAGHDALPDFLSACDLLVCLLPLTGETRGILCAENFAHLPQGAYLINAARGGHLAEADLIPAMEAGRLSGATLDVFETEPLPAGHPFWTHPAITVTPHDASMTPIAAGARYVAGQIERFEAGLPLENLVDFKRGY